MEFRLLVEADDAQTAPSIYLEGRRWVLSEKLDIEDDASLPSFACISYLWGPDREPHPLSEGLTMSTRTLPSLAASIRAASPSVSGFWTDVFCVPHSGAERQSTLENMGYIYHRASEVIVVLGEESFSVIQEMVETGLVSEKELHILETDEWVRSVWTYQEIVNGQYVKIVSSKSQAGSSLSQSPIEVEQFLNMLGQSLQKWQVSNGLDAIATIRTFPNLNTLEDVILDYIKGGYTINSAFAVFSSMSWKRNADPTNFFCAALGALIDRPELLVWQDPTENLAEKVMRVCERKNDFSYIYSVAARDSDPKRKWRPRSFPLFCDDSPVPPMLCPILSQHSWGEAQYGQLDANGLWLHGMSVMRPVSTIADDAKAVIAHWLHIENYGATDVTTLKVKSLDNIRAYGFKGDSDPLSVEKGFVYTLNKVDGRSVERVLVSHHIRWAMGAPCLVQIGQGDQKQYIPSAFIGDTHCLHDDGETVLL